MWAGGFRSWSLDADLSGADRRLSAARLLCRSLRALFGRCDDRQRHADRPAERRLPTRERTGVNAGDRALTDRERNVLRIYADRVEIWPQDGAMIAPAAGPAWQDALSFILCSSPPRVYPARRSVARRRSADGRHAIRGRRPHPCAVPDEPLLCLDRARVRALIGPAARTWVCCHAAFL